MTHTRRMKLTHPSYSFFKMVSLGCVCQLHSGSLFLKVMHDLPLGMHQAT